MLRNLTVEQTQKNIFSAAAPKPVCGAELWHMEEPLVASWQATKQEVWVAEARGPLSSALISDLTGRKS